MIVVGRQRSTMSLAQHALLLGSPILEPDLNDAHVETRLGADPLSGLSARLGTVDVRPSQSVQLTGGNGRSRLLGTRTAVSVCQSTTDSFPYYFRICAANLRMHLLLSIQSLL